uniref:MiaB/RimO family radical SAM methylthiotransferase n=1 Tax=Fundidesulfovibrio putealis TaxID=270496 RepID=A0A7C4A8H6_9BACT
MRFHIATLGCKINQYESQSLREAWIARGWQEVDAPAQAQMVLVHTCAVTAGAVADSRGAVRRAGREAPEAQLLVAGCAAQVEPESFAQLHGVCAVVPQRDKAALRRWPGPSDVSDVSDASGANTQAGDRAVWPDFSITRFHRARPILKVQDGCSHCCTYCIVPRARGGPRSRPLDAIVAEARRLLEAGHRELILSGINLGQFRLDKPGGDFWDMLVRLEAALAPQWAGRARLRLSSLDPGMLTARGADVLAGSSMVCPHLHVSLQSADPGVLAAMGRAHYGPDDVLGFLERLRGRWGLFALGADILTGFPGEGPAAFEATRAFMERVEMSYAHVFPYSRRPGTLAARVKDQLDAAEKKRRARALRDAAQALEEGFLARLAALPELEMAVERDSPGAGASQYYVECVLDGPAPAPVGALARVRPVGTRGQALEVAPAFTNAAQTGYDEG